MSYLRKKCFSSKAISRWPLISFSLSDSVLLKSWTPEAMMMVPGPACKKARTHWQLRGTFGFGHLNISAVGKTHKYQQFCMSLNLHLTTKNGWVQTNPKHGIFPTWIWMTQTSRRYRKQIFCSLSIYAVPSFTLSSADLKSVIILCTCHSQLRNDVTHFTH